MFAQIKTGHVLRFGVCPSTIVSPPGAKNPTTNDNTLATPWPTTSDIGQVELVSHPSGATGDIAAAVVKQLRDNPNKARSLSYSAVGRALTESNRVLASTACDFVGYVDGQANYIQSAKTVFSKDFSGCLMVSYTLGAQRHIAHAASSDVAPMDCKQAFLTTLQGLGATLDGWFRPFSLADSARKMAAFAIVGPYINNQINNLVTFGVITSTGESFAIDAFLPTGGAAGEWIVTYAAAVAMRNNWTVS